MLELKLDKIDIGKSPIDSYNRTMLELKCLSASDILKSSCTYNRTMLELKFGT